MAAGKPNFENDQFPICLSDPNNSNISSPVDETNEERLSGYRLAALVFGLSCCVFCTALDGTIVATSVPKIATQFHSLEDVGWYASSYMLTTCAVTLPFGRIYTLFPAKWAYLSALFLFELGSLICGIAPSSLVFIIGRAISGLGGRRPLDWVAGYYFQMCACTPSPSILRLDYGLGGVFTDHVTWRLCFYINLPFGAITGVTVFFTFQNTKPIVQATLKEKLWGMDPLGTIIFVSAIVSLLLALQWGGSVHPWGDGRIIALFVVFGALLGCFLCLQLYLGKKAILPPHLICMRNIWGSALFAFCANGVLISFVYYLPIWFQAVKGTSATRSGLMNLPFILSNVLMTMLSGAFVTMIRYLSPFMLLSAAMTCISAGILTTLEPTSGPAKWVGYQLFLGIAIGTGFQLPIFVVQTTLPATDIPIATALMTFAPLLGGSVFVSVAQNLFNNRLVAGLKANLTQSDVSAVLQAGPTGLWVRYQGATLQTLLKVYNAAVTRTFYAGIGLAATSFIGAAVVQWRSPKQDTNDNFREEGDVSL
ncbi:hypothetical protein N7478_005138 [Penicillium angulare]|uniref:uncharacterized protein n=1 Tax=Penicillium angulare TaxID=116970 RepID=UPI0025403F35|nr:uncharacterized protein N7478_005138 [Penicillium angulare]KAJ5279766.1 hypothetical protein N7478_005138 [Penicillium angulare]